MNIVWAVPLVPYPPSDGGSIRIYRLLKLLAQHHVVHLLALSSGAHNSLSLRRLRELCEVELFEIPVRQERRLSKRWWQHHWTAFKGPAVSYYQPALHRRLMTLIGQGQADVVLLETLKMAGYNIAAQGNGRVHEAVGRMILCRQNCETVLARRIADVLPLSDARAKALWRLGHWRLASVEPRIVRRYRFITAVSEQEANTFRRYSPHAEVVVVPNGTDVIAGEPVNDDGQTVALIGSLGYLPNQDAARYFYQAIWPLIRLRRPDARLVVAGRDARKYLGPWLSDPSVTICDSATDPRDVALAASVVAVPLRAGAGTRIKILEALAAGKAVVSTSIGCEGLDVVAGRDLLVADDAALFAQQVVQVLTDANLRSRLGASGRSLVESHYRWDSAADALERFCLRVADRAIEPITATA